MAGENTSLIEPIRSPWRERLLAALARVRHDLLLVGPYIKDDVIAMLRDALATRPERQPLSVRVITRILPDDFLSGASDIAALQHVLAWPAEIASVELRAITNLHAKVWAFDDDLAIVSSGNATSSGLDSNLEYGLAVAEPQLVLAILQDWQAWWEQAMPVNPQMLEQVQQWLTAIASDEEIRRAEKVAQEKRQAAERQLGVAPFIGKRLVMAGSGKKSSRPVRSLIGEHPEPYPAEIQREPEPSQEATFLQLEMVRVSASHLWQALCWTVPLASFQSYTSSETFLKIVWKHLSPAFPALQCIWADGKRFSQAAIPGHVPDIQQMWIITLESRAIAQLAEFLSDLKDTELLIWRQSSPPRLCVFPVQRESSVPFVAPCIPAALPAADPPLCPPLSQIIVAHEQLVTALAALKQNWAARYPATALPTTIELLFA